MNYKNALKILEIYTTQDLCVAEVKRKYRMMALLCHPDKNPAADAHERFQEVHEAYEFLMDYLKDDNLENGIGVDIDTDNQSDDLFAYKDILIKFLRSISLDTGGEPNTILYNIIHKITEKCEEKSLELLGKLNKDMLLRTYDIIYKYRTIFRISEDFVLKVQGIVEDRLKHDECIILNPSLEDLFEHNIYKLVVGKKTLLIPLWHHELVYDNEGADLYVKNHPILSDDYMIDNENNLTIRLQYNIRDLLEMDNINVIVGKNQYKVPIEELRLLKHQKLVLTGAGIPRIINGDIYNVTKLADVVLDVELVG